MLPTAETSGTQSVGRTRNLSRVRRFPRADYVGRTVIAHHASIRYHTIRVTLMRAPRRNVSDPYLQTTMGNVCKNVLAICNVSSAAFARAAVTDMSKVITVPVQKQQLIIELFKTSKTRSSLMALGIFYGLMDLLHGLDATVHWPSLTALSCLRV